MKIIKFADNMPKLQGQKTAKLVFWSALTGNQLAKHPELWKYDTLKSDGTNYKLNKNCYYFLLFFVGDKGIMFSTIRKLVDENKHYMSEVNETFKIEVLNTISDNKGVKTE